MTAKGRQAQYSGTEKVTSALAFDEDALAGYLKTHLDGYAGPLTVSRFRGGQSNPTYRLDTPGRSYVLRRKPPGKLLASAHAIDREFKVISALAPTGFPVPQPFLLCMDETLIGTPFYVMEMVAGTVFWEPHIPAVTPSQRAAIFDQLNETLACLHSLDVDALGLAGFGKPQGYVARQISRWSKQYKASQTSKIPEMDRLMDWLPDAAPSSGDVALVHGDFRLDNCVIDTATWRIAAVLDWELSTLGDPVADFTYHLMQWQMPKSRSGVGVGTLKGREKQAPGIPAMEDYTAAYCARTQRKSIADLEIWLAYNFFRMAAIYQGIVGRVRAGTASNANAAKLEELVEPMAKVAWDYAKRAGA